MFRPIYILPRPENPDYDAIPSYKDRWTVGVGKTNYDLIIKKIKAGAGEDFLQYDFENGALRGFMNDQWDLKGINIQELDIDFPRNDSFENINFSFAEFWHSKFQNATFVQTYFGFTKFYNFEFSNCLFTFTNFYGAKFENVKFINCEFIEHTSFNNCEFINCEFADVYLNTNIFTDCLFDIQTKFGNISTTQAIGGKNSFDNKEFSSIYKGIKDSYLAGEVFEKYWQYYFFQRHSETRYIIKWPQRGWAYFLEIIMGYGIRPLRVFIAMLAVFIVSCLLFSLKIGFSDGLILTSGALFTFGANADKLKELGTFYKLLYIATSFFGVSLIALFITVLANKWLKEK